MSDTTVLDKSAVVGAGLMGTQIGLVLAMGSREIALMSRHQETLDRALDRLGRYAEDLARHGISYGGSPEEVLGRIRTTKSLEDAVEGAEFVVESVFEDLEVKQEVFARLDASTPEETILASNTSSLPITGLAEGLERPERVVGSHFVQPAHIVPVVEVIGGRRTTDEIVERTCTIWRGLRKMPLRVRRDVPGFLVNRLQHALIREAVSLLAQGVADAEDIDAAVSLGLAPRFTTAGPLEQRDINGLGMHVRVARYLWKELGDGWQEPLAYLEGMVERGELGLEVGRGYYDWTGKDPDAVRREKDELLLRRTKDVMGDKSDGAI